jgi:hypothetical protein
VGAPSRGRTKTPTQPGIRPHIVWSLIRRNRINEMTKLVRENFEGATPFARKLCSTWDDENFEETKSQSWLSFQNALAERISNRETHCQQTNPFEGIGFANQNREWNGGNVTLISQRTL